MTFVDLLTKANSVEVSATVVTVMGGIIEFLLGVIKTDKPARVAYLIAGAFIKWGQFLDSVLPQNIKDVPSAQPASDVTKPS